MPRKAREKSSTNIYHIVIRGADRQVMFEDAKDRLKYLDILDKYIEECNFDLLAYCLMSNHVHLLVRINDISLDSIFRKINTTYSMWFNMKYQRTGFLLQGRYYSEPVEDLSYFMSVVKYIHLNPLNSGLEKSLGSSFTWSSFKEFTFIPKIVNTSLVLSIFNGLENFLAFHKNNLIDENILDIDNIKIRIPDDVAKDIIATETNCQTSTEFQNLSIRERNKYLVLLNQKGVSIRQLNRLTGTPKGVISRVISKNRSA